MASSNYVGARSIEELAAALEKFNYTPRTEAERRAQSENLYRTQLNQALRNAQQTYEESDLALANQLIGLDTGYDRQRQSQEEAIRSAISQADRRALSRGMQRSTYNNATLANLQNKGNEALARIEENRANDRADVEAQRAQLSRNLARAREGANADFQNQVLAEMQRMADEDYQRRLTADQNNNNTQLQLYASQQAEDQFNQNLALKREQMAQEQKQFEDQMWFNRQKAGLGWSTAADAMGNGTGTGTGAMTVGEQNKQALLNAMNGTAGAGVDSSAVGRAGLLNGAARGDSMGARPTIQPVDGGTPGYEDGYAKWLSEQTAGAATGANAGRRSSNAPKKQVLGMDPEAAASALRNWGANPSKWGASGGVSGSRLTGKAYPYASGITANPAAGNVGGTSPVTGTTSGGSKLVQFTNKDKLNGKK